MPPLHADVRKAAHWRAGELYNELPDGHALSLEPHFTGWMTAYRITQRTMYQRAESHDQLRRAKRQAVRYYLEFLSQTHHTPVQRTHFEFLLAWSLLMACGHFGVKPASEEADSDLLELPQPDYLRVESLLFGHYANLTEAVGQMIIGQGYRETRPPRIPQIIRLWEPFLPDN